MESDARFAAQLIALLHTPECAEHITREARMFSQSPVRPAGTPHAVPAVSGEPSPRTPEHNRDNHQG